MDAGSSVRTLEAPAKSAEQTRQRAIDMKPRSQSETPAREEWLGSQVAASAEALEAGDGCHADEAESLAGYLDGRLTAHEAALAFTKPVLDEAEPAASLYRPMALLCEALVELGHDRDKLLRLVAAIQALPPAGPISWAGLPGFGDMWSDLYRAYADGPSPWETSEGPREAELCRHFEAVGTVEAELFVRGLGGVPASWGYKTLSLVCSSRAGLGVLLHAMHPWLAVAGPKLRLELEPDEVCGYGERQAVETTMAEHWEAWKRAFLQASQKGAHLTEEARQLAAECHDLMK
ncbi:hypothetical protein CDD83_2347 [Cordyceps sp. RAO-2017]|nr:hypothetical protein CDD83_2347 [Cordyceps sp. RAO-2017]